MKDEAELEFMVGALDQLATEAVIPKGTRVRTMLPGHGVSEGEVLSMGLHGYQIRWGDGSVETCPRAEVIKFVEAYAVEVWKQTESDAELDEELDLSPSPSLSRPRLSPLPPPPVWMCLPPRLPCFSSDR